MCVTGVRWAESNARKNRRPFEIIGKTISEKMLFDDNDEGRMLFERCAKKGKRVVNPIVDWDDSDVWEFIKSRSIPYCELYDQGFTRLGCIGCPMAGSGREKGFERWPTYKKAYIGAFGRFYKGYKERCKKRNANPHWDSAEEMFEWWLDDRNLEKQIEGQQDFLEGDEE